MARPRPAPPVPPAASLPDWVRADGPQACRIAVAAVPGAARSELAGEHDGCLRIKLAAPPVDGKANDELVRFVASLLDLPRREVALVLGTSSRRKVVQVPLAAPEVARRLASRLEGRS